MKERNATRGASHIQATGFRIFLASPGDVGLERELARAVIEQVRLERAFRNRVNLEVIAWDQPGVAVAMEATLTPQEAITRGLPQPSECDLVVVILWSRMGTPLPADYTKPDGTAYLSGTEWEYQNAITAARGFNRPKVWLYRRIQAPDLNLEDPEFDEKRRQWQKVKAFFEALQGKDGSLTGGVNSYQTPDEFRRHFEQHLRDRLTAVVEEWRAPKPAASASTPVDAGTLGAALLSERIFISYGTADARAHARWLHGELNKTGAETWFAEEDIAPGTDRDAEINRSLSSAKALLVVLTPDSAASEQVRNEWNYALNHYLPVIPMIFATCDIPRMLNTLSGIDFRHDRNAALKKLTARLRDLDEKYPEELQLLLDAFKNARKTAPDPERYNGKINDLKQVINDWENRRVSQQQRVATGIEEERRAIIRESERQQKADCQRVVGQRLLNVADVFKGRLLEREELGRMLADQSTHVVSIIGRAGIGKTALASKILADLEQNLWPHTQERIPVDGIVYLSMRSTGITLERLFLDCARMLGGDVQEQLNRVWSHPRMGIAERIQKLLGALQGGLYVILLDHMEDLLDEDGRIVDEGLRIFLEQSLIFPHNARLMITSRTSLVFRGSAMRFDKQLPLPQGLSVPEGVAMLRELDPNGICGLRDAPEEQLARAVRHVHGVPRALEILAGIMAYDPLATLDDILGRFYENPDVVNDLIKEGYKLLGQDARRVMEALAVFKRPVPAAAVDFLLEPFVPGLDLPNILRRLVRSQVVKTDRTQGTMFIQPVEQDYAYQQCPQTEEYNCRKLELRAADYWARLRPPKEHWKTEPGLSPLVYEFDHLVRAAEYDRAAEVLGLFDLDYLVMRGRARQALSLRLQLNGKIQDRRQQMLHELGLARAYTLLGPLPVAIDTYKNVLSKARELGDHAVEAETLGWLGEVHRRTGKLEAAYAYLNSCLTLLRADGDRKNEARWLAEMTLLCIYRGALDEALEHGRNLLELAQKFGGLSVQALANDALSLAYLVLGQPQKAEDYADKALALYRESKWENELVYVMNVQGMARIATDRLDDGITRLQEAQKIAHEDNNARVEGFTLFNLARAFRMKNDLEMAFEAARAAHTIFAGIEAGGADAAGDLLDAIAAARSGNRRAEAGALLACAEHSLSVPDFLNPEDLAIEVCRIAEEEGVKELLDRGRAVVKKIKTHPRAVR